MDPDKRRQHVKQAFANIGENHAIPDENQISQESFDSFSYTPETNSLLNVNPEHDDELHIPRGTPSLFEAPLSAEEAPDEREVHPSPLAPGELAHVEQNSGMTAVDSTENVSLEDKFAQAINRPEAPVVNLEAAVEAPSLNEEVEMAPEQNQVEATSSSASEESHAEHLNTPAPNEVLEQHDDDDAGLGAMIMKQRAEEKAALEAN